MNFLSSFLTRLAMLQKKHVVIATMSLFSLALSLSLGTFLGSTLPVHAAPTVTILSPGSYEQVSGTVDITATTTEPVDSMVMDITINNQGDFSSPITATLGGDGNWHVSWNTLGTGYYNQSFYYITAKATQRGTDYLSDSVPANAYNQLETITSPTDGATVSGIISLTASVSNATTTPDSVSFVVNTDSDHLIAATDNHNGTWSATLDTRNFNESSFFPSLPIAVIATRGGNAEQLNGINVFVNNFQESAMSPTPTDGSTIYNTVNFAISVTGATASSVHYDINGHDQDFNNFYTTSVEATYNGSTWVASLDTTLIPEGMILDQIQAITTVGSSTESLNLARTLTVQNDVLDFSGPADFSNATGTITLSATIKNRAGQNVNPTGITVRFPITNCGTVSGEYDPAGHDWTIILNTAEITSEIQNILPHEGAILSLFCNPGGNRTYAMTAQAVVNGTQINSTNTIHLIVNLPTISIQLASPNTTSFCVAQPSYEECGKHGCEIIQPDPICTAQGIVPLSATSTPMADSVNFYIFTAGDALVSTIPGTQVNGHWIANWDSTVADNGTYKVRAAAIKAGYRSTTAISVGNVIIENVINNSAKVHGRMTVPLSASLISGTVIMAGKTDEQVDAVTFEVRSSREEDSLFPAYYDPETQTWIANWDTTGANQDKAYRITMKATKFGYVPLETSVLVGFHLTTDQGTLCDAIRSGAIQKADNSITQGLENCAKSSASASDANAFIILSPTSNGTASGTHPFTVSISPTPKSLTIQIFSLSGKETDISATPGTGNTWIGSFDTKTLPNGAYSLTATAVYSDGTPVILRNPLTFIVHNGVKTDNATFSIAIASPTSTGMTLKGMTHLEATTTQAVQSLDFDLTGAVSPEKIHATAKDRTKMIWSAEWNSTSTIDGDYLLSAIATTGTAMNQSPEIQVKIRNGVTTMSTTTKPLQFLKERLSFLTTFVYSPVDEQSFASTIDIAMGYINAKNPDSPCLPTQRYQSTTSTAVYYCGIDSVLHLFPNAGVYRTWYKNFDGIRRVAPILFKAIPQGSAVEYRPGTTLFKTVDDLKVYAVQPGAIGRNFEVRTFLLRWINSEDVARTLFGNDWAKKVIDVPQAYIDQFKKELNNHFVGPDIDASVTGDTTSTSGIRVDKIGR